MMKPIAVAGIAVVAAAAGGVGSYLAVRHAIGPVPELVSNDAAEPAPAVAEATPATEAQPASAATATDETVVEVEPAPADPPPAARPAPRREPAPPAPRREPAASASAEVASAPRNRAPAPPAAPVEPEPRRRPRPTAAPVTAGPEPEAEPAPVSNPVPGRPAGARARAATPEPTSGASGLPVVAGWARAAEPDAGTPTVTGPAADAAPPRADAERPPPAGTGLLDARAVDPIIAPDPWPAFDELQIAAESVIGIQVETAVNTRTARLEDPVEARVVRDVLVGPRVAIPSGARVRGSVVLVEPGGRLREASRLGVRFHTLVLDDGAEVTLSTETVYREGKSPGGDSVAKIGGAAVAGSILGAIFGGERGAAIGGSIGAAGGTAAALNGAADPATLPPGSRLTVRLSRPARVMVPR